MKKRNLQQLNTALVKLKELRKGLELTPEQVNLLKQGIYIFNRHELDYLIRDRARLIENIALGIWHREFGDSFKHRKAEVFVFDAVTSEDKKPCIFGFYVCCDDKVYRCSRIHQVNKLIAAMDVESEICDLEDRIEYMECELEEIAQKQKRQIDTHVPANQN